MPRVTGRAGSTTITDSRVGDTECKLECLDS